MLSEFLNAYLYLKLKKTLFLNNQLYIIEGSSKK